MLDICQKLYETHKLITYPRSDCRYLPEEHFAGRQAVMNAISVHARIYCRSLWLILIRAIAAG